MLGLPNEVLPGQQLRASDQAALLRYLRQTTPRSSAGTIVQAGSGGITRRPVPVRKMYRWPQVSSSTHPYKGSDASSGSTPKVAITPGSHNGIVPTINGVSMIPPVTMPPTPAPLLTLDASAQIVYVELDWTTGAITSAEINSSDSMTPPADSIDPSTSTGSSYQILFFPRVTIDPDSGNASVTCTDNVSGSQYAAICLNAVSYQLV